MRTASLVAVVLWCCGCADDRSISLTVEGDLVPGVDLDGLSISMLREGAEIWSARHAMDGSDALPLTFDIRPTSADDDAVDLVVSATLDRRAVVEATRATAFAHGRQVSVRLCLWRRCVGGGGEGCAEGRCDLPIADGDGDVDGDGDSDGDADEPSALCTDGCPHADDGVCQDGGDGATIRWCDYGTDCGDCGPRDPAACLRDCDRRECGSDGCGGICGPGCVGEQQCAPGGACVTWITVAADTFVMGAYEDEVGYFSFLEDAHEVTLTRDFMLAAREVSQDWLTSLLGSNTSTGRECSACPANAVTWYQAAAICNVLSRSEGLEPCYACSGSLMEPTCELDPALPSPYDCEGYRLPTEAEWELAARGGTTTATYNGDLVPGQTDCESPNDTLDPIAWFCGNQADGRIRPRGELSPNDFGFYDILGNVAEHTGDRFERYPAGPIVDPFGPATGDTRILRGGSTINTAAEARAAARMVLPPALVTPNAGMRVARTRP